MNTNDSTPQTTIPAGNGSAPAPTAADGVAPATPPPSNGAQKNQPAAETVNAPPGQGAQVSASYLPPSKTGLSSVIIAVLFYAAIGLGAAWYYWGPEPLLKYWPYIAGGLAVILVTVSLPATRLRFAHADAKWRIGMTLLISTVATFAFIVFVFLFEPDTQAAFLRLVFIMVVCSLPAVMYYLFIATKKYSLLNEFIINLGRLGLLYPSRVPPSLLCAGLRGETKKEWRKRIKTYLQKFESVYGKVPTNLSTFVIKPTDLSDDGGDDGDEIDEGEDCKTEGSFTDVFTFETTMPVLIATLLISLGWLITLPPWDGKLNLFNRAQQTGQLATAIETQSIKAPTEQTPAQSALAQESPATAGVQQSAEAEKAKPAEKVDRWLGVFSPVQSPVRFAFIGAYFFALQLLFRRYVRRDLRASAYVNISLRIILAMIGIWVVSAAVTAAPNDWLTDKDGGHMTSDNLLLVLGFVVGVFPRVAWQVVQATLKRFASVVVPSLQTQLPVSDLDGLTVWHEARFEEEDIENIPNMATADIVDLMINTRLPPDRIIDWVDQAILYTHLGPEEEAVGKSTRRSLLRAHGVRTASALVEAYNRSAQHEDRGEFEKILPGEGRNQIRSLVDAVGTHPNLKLVQTWRGLMPHTHEDGATEPHDAAKPQAKPESSNGAGSQAQPQNGAQSQNGGASGVGAGGAGADEGLNAQASGAGQQPKEAASQTEETRANEPDLKTSEEAADLKSSEEAAGKGAVETV